MLSMSAARKMGEGAPAQQRQSLAYKVVVVGDPEVGKTAFIRQYCYGDFGSEYKQTSRVSFHEKEIPRDGRPQPLHVQFYDIAGQEQYGFATKVFYTNTRGALVICDATKRNFLESTVKWKNDIDEKIRLPNGLPIPCVLLLNKCDLIDKVEIRKNEMDKFCKSHGFVGWFETSAKSGFNIGSACDLLLHSIDDRLGQDAPRPTLEKPGGVASLPQNTNFPQPSNKDKTKKAVPIPLPFAPQVVSQLRYRGKPNDPRVKALREADQKLLTDTDADKKSHKINEQNPAGRNDSIVIGGNGQKEWFDFNKRVMFFISYGVFALISAMIFLFPGVL